MVSQYFKALFCTLCLMLCFGFHGQAQENISEGQMKVYMRMIGHEVLLSLGDSTSRVLPIEKMAGRYRIQFENTFQFEPGVLSATINRVVAETQMPDSYLVEVEQCETGVVVYSYQTGNQVRPDVIPCKGRTEPNDCYTLFITMLGTSTAITDSQSTAVAPPGVLPSDNETNTGNFNYGVWIAGLATLLALLVYFWLRRSKTGADSNVISIGAYLFDTRSMELSFENTKTELTGKEADLLLLLHTAANTTLERDQILKAVWGDEGDYVGRTLDVFISKLRKKLEADPSLKIVNIRGIGYKLVLSDY